MARQIIIQRKLGDRKLIMESTEGKRLLCEPDLYCIWSSIVDDFIAFNATEEQIIEFFVAEARNNIIRKVKSACHELQCGEKPYFQFTMTFAEAIHHGQQLHGEDHYEFEEVPDAKET